MGIWVTVSGMGKGPLVSLQEGGGSSWVGAGGFGAAACSGGGQDLGLQGGSPTLCQPLRWCAGLTIMAIGVSHALWPGAQLSFPSTTPAEHHEAGLD